MSLFQLYGFFAFTFVIIFAPLARPMPASTLLSKDISNPISERESLSNSPEINLKDNFIQYTDKTESKSSNFPPNSSGKQNFQKDASQTRGNAHLSKFYRSVEQRSNTYSDPIVFPSSSLSNNNNYDRPFADRYNRHRPNIPTPQRSIPFNFAYGLPSFAPLTNPGPQRGDNNLLSPQQDELLYQTLIQLFRGLSLTPGQSQRTSNDPYSRAYSYVNIAERSTPTPYSDDLDDVNYQSLYSGPRVQKSPCANGQHRTHGGSCHEKSRKLLNSYG